MLIACHHATNATMLIACHHSTNATMLIACHHSTMLIACHHSTMLIACHHTTMLIAWKWFDDFELREWSRLGANPTQADASYKSSACHSISLVVHVNICLYVIGTQAD
jgi:hypothetical protein